MASKSDLEEAFALWVRHNYLPEPVREHVFTAPRKWRFDFAWLDRKVAVEIEGITSFGNHLGGHQTAKGFSDDCEKYEAALREGWRVYRIPGPWVAGGKETRYEQVMETMRILLGVTG